MTLLIDASLKGSILILAAALVAYFLREKSAAARHAAWTAAVIGHLAIPGFALLLPHWKLPLLTKPSWMETRVSDVAPITGSIIQATPPATPQPLWPTPIGTTTETTAPAQPAATVATPGAARKWSSLSVVAVLWIAGAAIVLLRLAVGTWKVGRLAKKGDRVDDGEWLSLTQRLANRLGITRPLTLLRGDKLAVPVTWGVVYPAVLLPHDSIEWPEARRRFVLVHEMAHVKRFDALTQLVAQIAIAIFWFDPLIWLASHRMRVEREHACDDYVIRDGTKPSLYAGELLEMVQSIGSPRRESAAPAFAALAMARRSEFEGRMLAILDSRQDRHTLNRKTAIAATAALALLVLPLAALRPFERPSEPIKSVATRTVTPATPEKRGRLYSDNACDSVMASSKRSGQSLVHVHTDSHGSEDPVVEVLTTSESTCTQGAIVGKTTFADDRLIALSDDGYVMLRELTPAIDRSIRITRRENGTMEFASSVNGKSVPYDNSMRAWLAGFLPKVLVEAGVGVPERVARDMARGGVDAVLDRIGHISSASSARMHYEALLDEKPLTDAEYARISRHASRTLASSPTDLGVVLTRIASGPAKGTKSLGKAVARLGQAQQALGAALENALDTKKSSRDSASTLTQYGTSDDPDMLLLALKGAADISSDTDKRILLQTLAAGSLRRSNPDLRKAFFDVVETMSSDTDVRVVLQAALPYGHSDPLVVSDVFRLVGERMSSDSDKRVVLVTAIEQKLLKTAKLREELMTAVKSFSSDDEVRVVMQALAKD